jgi:hypothetical protein
MYIPVKDLPDCVKNQIKSLGHKRSDINCHRVESVSPQYIANDGSRGVFSLVNILTGEKQTTYGSWGGPNMFVNPVVDACESDLVIPNNWVALKGSSGNLNLLTLYANEVTLTPLLPEETEPLPVKEHIVLWAHRSLKGGKYRMDYYREHKMTASQIELTIASLVGKGLLKVNKNGASTITTNGRNAASNLRELHTWSPEVQEGVLS